MSDCKGMVFRYIETAYIGSSGDVNFKKTLRPLKRQSCDGKCDRPNGHLCGAEWMMEHLREDISGGFEVEIPKEAKSEDTLKLCAHVSGGSYEYPNDVDIDLYFEVIKQ